MRIDLERYAARLEQAQRDCKDRFRKDILFRMKDDIFNARRQFRELNKVMEQLTYGEEVYRFELGPSRDPQLAAFYQVIVDKGNQQMTDGDSLDNLAATADPVYERQVDELMEKIMADVDENTRARQEGRRPENVTLSDYVDYRTYLDYSIKVTNTVSGQQASLSRVSRDSSGGENQAPFYVAYLRVAAPDLPEEREQHPPCAAGRSLQQDDQRPHPPHDGAVPPDAAAGPAHLHRREEHRHPALL